MHIVVPLTLISKVVAVRLRAGRARELYRERGFYQEPVDNTLGNVGPSTGRSPEEDMEQAIQRRMDANKEHYRD